MFLLALQLCSPEYFDEEMNNIYEIGRKNNFKNRDIDHCFDLAKNTFYHKKDNITRSKNFISLPYHPLLVDIVYPMKLLGLNLAFRYNNTVGKSLIRNSPIYDEGIIYKIPCGCGKFYVGQSGKSLSKRISQHKYNVARDDQQSAINNHTHTCNYPMKWKESKELFSRSDFVERNVMESACIVHTKDMNLNSNLGLFNLDPIVLHIFKQQYKLRDILPVN